MGDIKEIFDVWITRIRNPIFGYFSLSFIAANWESLFYLFLADDDVISRIDFFEANTCITTLLWIPLGISVVAALGYPWIQYFLIYATSNPNYRRNAVNAKAESDLLQVKVDLENRRNRLAREKEMQIVDKAEVDQRLESIEDENVRRKAQKEIKSHREKSEILGKKIDENSLNEYLSQRFPYLPINQKIVKSFLRDLDKDKYHFIEDVDAVLRDSTEFISFYENMHPEVFESGIDYITKAFGFSDAEFRKKHAFSKDTIRAIEDFRRE